MVNLAVTLKDHDFSGETIRMTVGDKLSGTDQRHFRCSARANVFIHPSVGVARTNPNDPLIKAPAVEREYICVDMGSAAMWIIYTYSGKRNDARPMFRRKASAAKRRGAPVAVEAARGEAVAGWAGIPAPAPDAPADAAAAAAAEAGDAAGESPAGVGRVAPAASGSQQPPHVPLQQMAGQPRPQATGAAAADVAPALLSLSVAVGAARRPETLILWAGAQRARGDAQQLQRPQLGCGGWG